MQQVLNHRRIKALGRMISIFIKGKTSIVDQAFYEEWYVSLS